MRERICKLSLFSVILACVAAVPADCAVKVKNSSRSYAGGYQQVNAMRAQQEYANAQMANAANALPVAVDDKDLANSIANQESNAPSVGDLEACSMIYPNGTFKWAVPESGLKRNQSPQCVAVVELRDANTHTVLATTTVAAGDSIKCNIDSFPEHSYNWTEMSKQNFELPADNPPTMQDVKDALNAEQKQNAGVKIVAGALIAGVAGNILAPKSQGQKESKLPLGIGGGKQQLVDTAIGAATGASIMAASTYSGKVAGDTIKSTAVNAASGMILGNILAGQNGGDNILAVTRCTIEKQGSLNEEHDCIPGTWKELGESLDSKDPNRLATIKNVTYGKDKMNNNSNEDTCKSGTRNIIYLVSQDGKNAMKCCPSKERHSGRGFSDEFTCHASDELTNIYVAAAKSDNDGEEESISFEDAKKDNEKWQRLYFFLDIDGHPTHYELADINETNKQNGYFFVTSASFVKNTRYLYAMFDKDLEKKPLGWQSDDWKEKLKSKNPKIYVRNSSGTVGGEITGEEYTKALDGFTPMTRTAEDGGLIDLSNQARTKGTLAGAGVGGALGGLSGYQGAKSELEERWAAAQREYDDSLLNFVCMTGGKWLSGYNSDAVIPTLESVSSEQK